MIDPDSRYASLAAAPLTVRDPQGREIRYVARRFLSPLATFETLAEVTVTRGDRLDLISGRTLGSPAAWWRVAEANEALDPQTLTAMPAAQTTLPPKRLRIPVPSA